MSNKIVFLKKQKQTLFAACCFFIYANLYTLQNNLAAFHNPINILLFYEMLVINVIDDFFSNCLLEIDYFVIKYSESFQFQVRRL